MLQRVVLTPPLDELEGLTDAELRIRYQVSNEAGQTWHVDFYRDEMRRRGSARSETTMRRLTWVIAALTVVNVVAVIVALVTA